MINRELIRLKLVQIIYSYYQNGSMNIEAAEKELELSLSRAYKLYASLLSLMVEVGRMGLRMEEMRRNRARAWDWMIWVKGALDGIASLPNWKTTSSCWIMWQTRRYPGLIMKTSCVPSIHR